MIDSHCHLADETFASDLDAVVARARAAGLERVCVILEGGNRAEAAQAERLQRLWPEVRFAVGVHPHQAHEFAADPDRAVSVVREQVAATPSARAIGEIGLDYHYDFSPRDVQRETFAAQIQTALDTSRPVVIHTREASADTFDILATAGRGVLRGVMHCFSGTADEARRALDIGFHISFSGILTFPKAGALRDVARFVPEDRLLVETDAPFLAPVPHRGKRNEPAWVAATLDALAVCRGANVADMQEVVARNFDALFPLR